MGKSKEAASYQRSGIDLQCPICRGNRFWQREAQLNTRMLTFLELDWINPKGDCYICEKCRHILWFYGENEKP